MKKTKHKTSGDLRPEYDLKTLAVRRLGSARKSFGRSIVRLEADVAKAFPNPDAVNEALRFLIRVTRKNKVNLGTAGKRA
jgi:hypothetical protein